MDLLNASSLWLASWDRSAVLALIYFLTVFPLAHLLWTAFKYKRARTTTLWLGLCIFALVAINSQAGNYGVPIMFLAGVFVVAVFLTGIYTQRNREKHGDTETDTRRVASIHR